NSMPEMPRVQPVSGGPASANSRSGSERTRSVRMVSSDDLRRPGTTLRQPQALRQSEKSHPRVAAVAAAAVAANEGASAAAESTAPAVAGFLPLAEEGRVVHRLPVRVLLQHVPDVVVIVGNAAAQARGLQH